MNIDPLLTAGAWLAAAIIALALVAIVAGAWYVAAEAIFGF